MQQMPLSWPVASLAGVRHHHRMMGSFMPGLLGWRGREQLLVNGSMGIWGGKVQYTVAADTFMSSAFPQSLRFHDFHLTLGRFSKAANLGWERYLG
jgi:hypothetical protein